MAAAVTFFNPTDLSGILDAAWEVQSATPTETSERGAGPLATGDEAASTLHNKKIAYSIVAKCYDDTGTLTLPVVGTVSSTGIHLDSFLLEFAPTDYPTITITCHKHNDGTSHTAASCKLYTGTLSFNAGWGIDRSMMGGATTAGFQLAEGDTTIGLSGMTYGVSVTHVDETGDGGNWLAGENRDGAETFTLGTVGQGATLTPPTDETHAWDDMSKGSPKTNTGADTESFEYVHHFEADV